MRIEHDLTRDDLATCNSMMLAASPPETNRSIALLTAVYGTGGGLLFGYVFHLGFWGFIALWGYVAGLVLLIVLALKRAAASRVTQVASVSSMKREYLLTDAGLEVRMPDLTQIIPAANIVRVDSRGRGTMVHLSRSTPLFLPFGSAFRNDFVEALRDRVGRP